MSETRPVMGAEVVPPEYIVTRVIKQRPHMLAAFVVGATSQDPLFFRAKTSSEEGLMENRLAREVEILSGLDHPQIPSYVAHGFTASGRVPYIVTERAPLNPHWQKRMDRFPSTERTVRFLLSALEPLAYTHSRGIAHRDIKDDNYTASNSWTASLVDFETAVADLTAIWDIGPAALPVKAGSTDDEMVCGTFQYIAPERIITSNPGSVQSDIYSMGVLMYRLLYGRMPFEGKGQVEDSTCEVDTRDVQKLLSQSVDLSKTYGRHIPTGLMAIIEKATMFYPRLRHENASHLLEEVGRYAVDNRISSYAV